MVQRVRVGIDSRLPLCCGWRPVNITLLRLAGVRAPYVEAGISGVARVSRDNGWIDSERDRERVREAYDKERKLLG